MREVELNGHKVRLYDSIDVLPITRFHVYNRMLLVDAGIGSDISDLDNHLERAVRYIKGGDRDNAAKELENLRQNVYMVITGQNVRHLSFACLVESIDGEPCDDLSQEGLTKIVEMLGGATRKEMTEVLTSVKKKIDGDLSLYFPNLFDDVSTREYYDTLKRLTVTMLQGITDGEDRKEDIERLQERLVLFVKPKVFTGHDGVEVQHDKNFETLCLMITKETGREAKRMTVLEYYNAYDYLTRQAKKNRKADFKRR